MERVGHVHDATTEVCLAMFLIASCMGGFCGYETVWMDLAAMRYDLEYWNQQNNKSAISWPLVGRFKSGHSHIGCYMILIILGQPIQKF